MPQYKRRVAFSGKKKKIQIQARRNKKLVENLVENEPESFEYNMPLESETVPSQNVMPSTSEITDKSSVYQQEVECMAGPSSSSGRSRYQLKFKKTSAQEKRILQKFHHKRILHLKHPELIRSSNDYYPPDLNYPKRPKWSNTMSKLELDKSENKYFRLFCEELDTKYLNNRLLNKYELNLETWRQLWRVTEMCDILLIIVDARFPVLQFPPYLYHDLVEEKEKDIVLVLNKCDLISPVLVIAWKKYFAEHFPKLHVVPFYSLEGCRTKRGLLRRAKHSSLALIKVCEKIVSGSVNISSWKKKIEDHDEIIPEPQVDINQNQEKDENYSRFKDGILTLGTIGFPNVGKSSLINALMGKKVVSVSKTPGHTKHFQTIFLTKSVRLCDCPGLVFPSLCPVELQVLSGSYPIAQYRDPLSVLYYLGTALDIPKRLNLAPTGTYEDDDYWTAYTIAESWAIKRSYFANVKGGKPDVHRSSNELLRFGVSGLKNLVLFLKPPVTEEVTPDVEELEEVKLIQRTIDIPDIEEEVSESEESSSEGEEDCGDITSTNKFSLLLDSED